MDMELSKLWKLVMDYYHMEQKNLQLGTIYL